jgi:polyphenol oxidase
MLIAHPQPNDGFEWTQAPWGSVLRCTPLAKLAAHFFTARDLVLRDHPEEWLAVAAHAGVSRDDLLLVRQVHEANVAVASADRPRPWPVPEADAIVSNDGSAAIGVRVADCVPILLADETGRAVAAIHAGWRGVAARAAGAGVAALRTHYGIDPQRLTAAIGPSIGPCCYEVGERTRDEFAESGHPEHDTTRWFSRQPGGTLHLDLWQAVTDQLENAGVARVRIHAAGLCTKTHRDAFHSYRVQGPSAGRMVGVIRPRG